MTNNESPQKNETYSMELLDSTVLECYLKATVQESLIDYSLSLDPTGTYLRLAGRHSPKTAPVAIGNEKDDKRFFLDHAFLFLRNADTILKDSRLFLAPVPVHSGLAYIGGSGFASPTLGVHIEQANRLSAEEHIPSRIIWEYLDSKGCPRV